MIVSIYPQDTSANSSLHPMPTACEEECCYSRNTVLLLLALFLVS